MPWRTPSPAAEEPRPTKPPRRGGFFSLLLKSLIGLLASIGLLVAVAVVLIVVVVQRYDGRDEAAELPERFVVTFDLANGLSERQPDNPLQQIAAPALSVAELHRSLSDAAADPRVACLAVRAGVGKLSLAQAQEISGAIAQFRDSGKFSLAFAATFGEGGTGLPHYLVASNLEEVWLQPSGGLDIRGFSIEQPFLREALDEIGIEPQFLQREEFKAATDIFQHRRMTEPVRRNLEALVNSWLAQVTGDIAARRGLEATAVDSLISQVSVPATEARDEGLVDRLGYLDEAEARVEAQCGDEVESIPLERYAKVTSNGLPEDAPVVALVHGLGPIVLGGPDEDFGRQLMQSDQVASAIEMAAKDDNVKAIVFRVDSPGGSYVASDLIWREIKQARENGKPVVVSMANVAASGGYFVAAPADRIVALPATVTGSIGVITGKFDTSGLWQELGVDWDGVKAGENADLWSFTQPFSNDQWNDLQQDIERIYDDFLGKVADGRGLAVEEVRQVAGGRIWSGADANVRGLVDALGGFDVALANARELMGVEADAPLRIVLFPEQRDPFTALLEDAFGSRWGPGLASTEAARKLSVLVEALAPLIQAAERLTADPRENVLRAPGF